MKSRVNAQKGDRFALLKIVFSAILWGTVGVVVQIIYTQSETNPVSIAFFRLAIQFLYLCCLLPVCVL